MKMVRRWPVLVLLGVLVDLVNPALPGVFSLLNSALFMDGVTRPHGVADAKCVRACPRGPAAEAPHVTGLPARPQAARDTRRAHERPLRCASHVTAAVTCDTEDH